MNECSPRILFIIFSKWALFLFSKIATLQHGAGSLHYLANKAKPPPSRGYAVMSLRQTVASLLEITKPPHCDVLLAESLLQANLKPLQLGETSKRGCANCLQGYRTKLATTAEPLIRLLRLRNGELLHALFSVGRTIRLLNHE